MQKRRKGHWLEYLAITAAMSSIFVHSLDGTAAGAASEPLVTASGNTASFPEADNRDEKISAPEEEGILSVELPVVAEGERSPFDFILDPCGLVYETDAMRYGGGAVEEGATMLFYNEEGEYDFSRYSDKLSIMNQSGKSVIVTISASVSDMEGIDLVGQNDFSGNDNPAVYLAVTDDRGNEQPIYEDGEAKIQAELDSGIYSFGLTGACNPDADWQDVYVHPKVIVTWHVESVPMEPEEETGKEPEEVPEKEPEEGTEGVSEGEQTESDSAQEDLAGPAADGEASADKEPDRGHEADGSTGSNGSDEEPVASDLPAEEDDIHGQDIAGDTSESLIPSGEMADGTPDLGDDGNQPEETVPMEGTENNP